MNFGNTFSPYGISRTGSLLKNGINWSNILTNTQKTLGVINQAIPVFYQIRPMFNNIKTMFRVASEINSDDSNVNNDNISNNNKNNTNIKNNVKYETASSNVDDGPNFFI